MCQRHMESRVKEEICEIGRRMYMRGFVAANDGNISVKINDNEIIATPTGVSKGFMTPEMLCKIDMKGNVIEGYTKPSSEIKMHLKVYEKDDSINSVTHAHPPYATTFAIARQPLDRPLLPEAIINLGIVPVAEYAIPGTDEVPRSIENYIKSYKSVLLANHGAVTWGKDLTEAFYRLETVEHYAHILYLTRQLGQGVELSPKDIHDLTGS